MVMSGPELNAMVERLRKRYLDTKEVLIKALTKNGPYGSVKLTPEEQLENFLSMSTQDLEELSNRLALRYRGRPDANEKVQQELEAFFTYMAGLHERLRGNGTQ
jgi:hypothetical protein